MNEKGGTSGIKETKLIDIAPVKVEDPLQDQLLRLYLDFYRSEGFIDFKGSDTPATEITGRELLGRVNLIRSECGDDYRFFTAYMNMAHSFSGLYFPERDSNALREKVDFVLEAIKQVEDKKEVINEILNSGLISQLDFIDHSPLQEIIDTLSAKFYTD